MPLNTVTTYLLGLLDDIPVPVPEGAPANLQCFITPPDPNNLDAPTIYLWPVSGHESRLASPRAAGPNVVQAGWKTLVHNVDLWITWSGSQDDPTADTNFPAVVDAVLSVLRSSTDEVVITDPVSGAVTSVLIGIGEDMGYEYVVLHSLQDQAYLRYDARLTITVTEYFQS